MKLRTYAMISGVVLMLALFPMVSFGGGKAVKFSCSAQIHEAFGKDFFDGFTKETGIPLEVYVSSSDTALYRLMNGFSDIAGTTKDLYYRHMENGYVEIPVGKDPLVVIVNHKTQVKSLGKQEIRQIFNKYFTNWKDLGGPDKKIVVIVPSDKTAAYKNFNDTVMLHREIRYDYMAFRSTNVIEAVKCLPNTISFVSKAAASNHPGVGVVDIEGIAPDEKDYPYFQEFKLVTKGKDIGIAVQKFIDYMRSAKSRDIMKKKGIIPIP